MALSSSVRAVKSCLIRFLPSFSSFFAIRTRYRDVSTYSRQKIPMRYQMPLKMLTPASSADIPTVKGLKIAVVKPTPEVMRIKLTA